MLSNITKSEAGKKPSVYYYDRSKKQIVKSNWPRVRMWFIEKFPRLFSGTRERTIIGIIGSNLANMPKIEGPELADAKQKLQGAVAALYRQDPAAIDNAIAELSNAKEETSGGRTVRPQWAQDALTGLLELGIVTQSQERVPPTPSPSSTPPPASTATVDPQLADTIARAEALEAHSQQFVRVRTVYEFNKKLLNPQDASEE